MSLGTTGEVKANPQLSSVVSAFTSKPIVTISIIVHSKSASRGDASASLTAGADLDPSDETQSAREGLKIILNQETESPAPFDDKEIKMAMTCEDQAEVHMGTNDNSIHIITGQDSNAHLPAELKILLEKMSVVTKIMGELKEFMESLELDFPPDLKEILTKLTEFTTSLSALTSRVEKY
ncbi:hypothetical protein Tco_0018488 [Tanacetum coccineum]